MMWHCGLEQGPRVLMTQINSSLSSTMWYTNNKSRSSINERLQLITRLFSQNASAATNCFLFYADDWDVWKSPHTRTLPTSSITYMQQSTFTMKACSGFLVFPGKYTATLGQSLLSWEDGLFLPQQTHKPQVTLILSWRRRIDRSSPLFLSD